MKIEITCPFGSKCEEVKNNKIHRCRWYINIRGKHPQTEEVVDQWDCAMAWMPLVMVENAQTNRGQTQALESFRNEMAKGQKEFNLTFLSELERRKNLEILEEKVTLMILGEKQKKLLPIKKGDGDIITLDVKED